MNANSTNTYMRKLSTPFILLILCLLALVVSLIGLYRTSSITHARVADLQVSWQTLIEGQVSGSELLATDRLMNGIARPVPAVESAAGWSLALAALSLVFLVWLIMAARAVERAKSREAQDSDRNDQAAMAKLLDEIAPLASGDLDVRATVRRGTAGALADAFNYAVSELQRLTAAQLATSRSVSDAVGKSHEIVAAIEQRCNEQSNHIHRSSNYLLGLSSTASELSAHAAGSSRTLNSLVGDAEVGLNELRQAREQAQDAQGRVDSAIKRLQTLGAHTQHVQQAVTQLDDLARRIDVLVLNAALRTSAAGEQDMSEQSMSVIEELSDALSALVEEINRTNSDINSNIISVDADVSEALSLVQGAYTSTRDNHRQIMAADTTLQQIQIDAQNLQRRVASMTEQTVQHAGVVKDLSSNMDLINQITQNTVMDVRNNADQLDDLRKLSNESRQSLSDLNMPDNGVGRDTSTSPSAARRAAERAVING